MRALLRPLPRAVTRPISILLVIAWIAVMAVLINRSYVQASTSLATDLARYGSAAVWRGVYYRGEKIGFTVSQTVAKDDGFHLEEDGRLQMSLLGATTGGDAPHHRARRQGVHAALVRVLARSGNRCDRSPRHGRRPPAVARGQDADRHAPRNPRPRRAAGALVEHLAAPRQRRPGCRREVSVDRVRSGDAAQLEGQRRDRPARAGARRRRRAAAGVPRRDGIRGPEDLVVDYRHRRGGARGEPARADHRPRVGRERESDGGVAADAGGSAAGRRRGSPHEDADRRTARRPPDAHSPRRRRLVEPGSRRRRAAIEGQRPRAARSAGADAGAPPIPTPRAISPPKHSSKAMRRKSSRKPRRP